MDTFGKKSQLSEFVIPALEQEDWVNVFGNHVRDLAAAGNQAI